MEKNADGGSSVVTVVNALSTILAYSGVSPEVAAKFEEQIGEFKHNDNRYDSEDEARALRRNLGNTFYEVFTPAFIKSLNDDNYPMEVKMFFMFGFVDEELAGEANTKALYEIMKTYRPDPDHTKIYDELYQEYVTLHDFFGRDQESPMKKLLEIKKEVVQNTKE